MDKLGYDKPLYILPFDHRATFAQNMFGLSFIEDLSEEQIHLVKEFKMLIYKGFKKALGNGIPANHAAILCDEQFGSEVLIDAKHNGFITILTTEKSGRFEFRFQYGTEFKEHIEKFKPTFTKVLVKYNPADSDDLKIRQKEAIKQLSDYSHENNYKFLLELLVIPTDDQLGSLGGRESYDINMRPSLTVEVIKDFQLFGIEPDVWKIEGFEKEEHYADIIKSIRAEGRDKVSLVILGRGANEEKVDDWLRIGSRVEGVIGFAVGRTVFWQTIEKFNKGEIGKAEVINTVAENFFEFYEMFVSGSH